MAELTRGELVDLVIKQANDNEEYRKSMLSHPKLMLGRQLGRELPDWLNVKVVEESADTMVVVLPHVAKEGDELADADLEAVAGGKSDDSSSNQTSYSCDDASGMATHIIIETTTDVGMF